MQLMRSKEDQIFHIDRSSIRDNNVRKLQMLFIYSYMFYKLARILYIFLFLKLLYYICYI